MFVMLDTALCVLGMIILKKGKPVAVESVNIPL
jgi:hypothetical protein